MPTQNSTIPTQNNLLLGEGSPSDRAYIEDFGINVNMPLGTVLFDAGSVVSHVFFPAGGAITFLVFSDNGSMIEAGFVGREGAAGTSFNSDTFTHFTTAKVVVATEALRLPIERFSFLLDTSAKFRSLVTRNNNLLSERSQQLAACNLMHRLEMRLSRWLLQTIYTSRSLTIEMTQDSLAQLLGVTRARLNEALKALQQDGVLAQSPRALIQIANASRLRQMSCDCINSLRVARI